MIITSIRYHQRFSQKFKVRFGIKIRDEDIPRENEIRANKLISNFSTWINTMLRFRRDSQTIMTHKIFLHLYVPRVNKRPVSKFSINCSIFHHTCYQYFIAHITRVHKMERVEILPCSVILDIFACAQYTWMFLFSLKALFTDKCLLVLFTLSRWCLVS